MIRNDSLITNFKTTDSTWGTVCDEEAADYWTNEEESAGESVRHICPTSGLLYHILDYFYSITSPDSFSYSLLFNKHWSDITSVAVATTQSEAAEQSAELHNQNHRHLYQWSITRCALRQRLSHSELSRCFIKTQIKLKLRETPIHSGPGPGPGPGPEPGPVSDSINCQCELSR